MTKAKVPAWLDVAAAHIWRGALVAAAVVAAARLVAELHVIAVPIVVAATLSTVSAPLVDRLERHRIPRGAGAFALVAGTYATIGTIGWAVAPGIVEQLRTLIPTVAVAVGRIADWIDTTVPSYDTRLLRAVADDPLDALGVAAAAADGYAVGFAGAVGEAAVMVILTGVLWFYLTRDRRRIGRFVIDRLPARHRAVAVAVGGRASASLAGYVRGATAVAVIDAVGIGVGIALLGVPLAAPIGLLVFVGSYIPIVGATVTGTVAVLVALADRGLGTAVAVAVVVVAVQQIEAHLLQPLIMRRAVNLHPIVTLSALTAGGALAGIGGVAAAVPTVAVAVAVTSELRRRAATGSGIVGGDGDVPG